MGSVTSFPVGDDGVTLGDPTPILQLEGSGPNPDRQTSPHPHNVVEYGDEVLIPDLACPPSCFVIRHPDRFMQGSDKVWRLIKGSSGGYEVAASVDMVPGSGPRHAVAEDGLLYVVHELDNTLTTYTLPPLTAPSAKFRFHKRQCSSSSPSAPTSTDAPPTSTDAPTSSTPERPTTTSTDAPPSEPSSPPSSTPVLLSSVSIVPEDGPTGSSWGGGELVISPKDAGPRFLYASNRNVGTTDERGDPIAVAAVDNFGKLTIVHEAYTGLQHVRAMALGGDQGQYIIAAGMNAGGVAIFERQEDGDLKLLDRYTGEGSQNLASFAWV